MSVVDLMTAKEQVAETGRRLLKEGLVARTWGNISCRTVDEKMVITPSGMGYDRMTTEDVVVMNYQTMEWEGDKKPSSEKGIHAGAYKAFPDVNYVIHTHQNYATAIGLAGFDTLEITPEEKERLGGIAMAKYGLPGTKTLKQNVEAAYATGAKVVLLAHHGAVICGANLEDAMEKSVLLEAICKRNTKGVPIEETAMEEATRERAEAFLKEIRQQYPYVDVVNTAAGLKRAEDMSPVVAQVDDMAQIIGAKIIHANPNVQDILQKLAKREAVMVRGMGVFVKATEADDLDAMKMLAEKAIICNLHTKALGVKGTLSFFDTALMRRVYLTKYSKRK